MSFPRNYLALLFALLLLGNAQNLYSQTPPPEEEIFTKSEQENFEKEGYVFEREQELYNDTTSVILALSLGFFVHGSGHFYSGDTTTGFALLGMEAASLTLLGASAVAYASGDGSNTALIAPLFQSGFALFVFSYLADVVGSISGPKEVLSEKPNTGNDLEFTALYNFTSSRGSPYRHALDAQLHLNMKYFEAELETIQDVFLETAAYRASTEVKYSPRYSRTKIGAEIAGGYLVHSGRGPFSRITGRGFAIAQLDLGDLFKQLRGFVVGLEAGYGLNWWSFANAENEFVVHKRESEFPVDFFVSMQLTPRLRVSGGYGYSKNPSVASLTPLLGVAHFETSFQTSKLLKLHFETQVGDGFSGSLGVSISIF